MFCSLEADSLFTDLADGGAIVRSDPEYETKSKSIYFLRQVIIMDQQQL